MPSYRDRAWPGSGVCKHNNSFVASSCLVASARIGVESENAELEKRQLAVVVVDTAAVSTQAKQVISGPSSQK